MTPKLNADGQDRERDFRDRSRHAPKYSSYTEPPPLMSSEDIQTLARLRKKYGRDTIIAHLDIDARGRGRPTGSRKDRHVDVASVMEMLIAEGTEGNPSDRIAAALAEVKAEFLPQLSEETIRRLWRKGERELRQQREIADRFRKWEASLKRRRK